MTGRVGVEDPPLHDRWFTVDRSGRTGEPRRDVEDEGWLVRTTRAARRPAEGSELTVFVGVQLVEEADYDALDRIIQSFVVTQ